jgi:hypothetical protein
MSRAYIVLARKDIDDNNLQILDLQPNTSLRNPIYEGAGQTGYLAWTAQNDAIAHTNVGGVLTATAIYVGLATYIGARVDDITGGGHVCVSAANANAAASAILGRVRLGLALNTAGINAAIQSVPGLATSGITGTGNSTATVEEILRILGGEVFQIAAAAAFSGAGGIFLGTGGAFVTSTNTAYRNVRTFIDTGSLRLSRHSGYLSVLSSATHVWNNPAKTYAPTNYATGTAVCGAVIAADTFIIKRIGGEGGVVFTAQDAVPDPALQQFRSVAGSGSAIATATTLVATINNAVSQAALLLTGIPGVTVTASNVGGTSATVTLTANITGAKGVVGLNQTGGTITITAMTVTNNVATQSQWVDDFNMTSTTGRVLVVYDNTGALIL